VFMLRRSTSQKTTFLSLEPDENCMLCSGFQATQLTASLCPTKVWTLNHIKNTFLLRFLMSQKQMSPSYPPESNKWGLFLLKSREYTSPAWAFLVRIGPDSFDLISHLHKKYSTCIFFHLAEHFQKHCRQS